MASAKGNAIGTNRCPARADRQAPRVLVRLLESADVRLNGGRPLDIQVRDASLYDRVLRQGSLGFGESYMDGAWESDRLDVTFDRLLTARLNKKIGWVAKVHFLDLLLRNLLLNRSIR